MSDAFAASSHFIPPADIYETAKNAEAIVSLGNQTGEGWFLTGEMLELLHTDTPNIVCTQPFGCLPNHVVGKGVIKELRKRHPEANIVAIDYDPGASEVNQLNRIKLMLSTALKNLNTAEATTAADELTAVQGSMDVTQTTGVKESTGVQQTTDVKETKDVKEAVTLETAAQQNADETTKNTIQGASIDKKNRSDKHSEKHADKKRAKGRRKVHTKNKSA